MKKYILGTIFTILFVGSSVVCTQNTYGQSFDSYINTDASSNGFGVNTTTVNDLHTIGTTTDQGGGLIDVIKRFINWTLGILSLIVLIIVLIGGFQMVTAAGNDSRYKKGFTLLKQAGVGLIIIGLAWFIVSIVFRIIRGSANVTTTTTSGS